MNASKHRCRLVASVILALTVKAPIASAAIEACRPIRSQDELRLLNYVARKYEIPESVRLSMKEASVVSEDCYRKLLFSGEGPLGTFTLKLYISPDLRFLSPEIFDSFSDPVAEQQEKARNLMGDLAEGEFASQGARDAPLTVVVFSDFQCPYCKQMAEVLRNDASIKSGVDVRLIFRHFPLPQHDWAQQAALAAACAEFQNEEAFWAFHDALFAEQSLITASNISAKIRNLASRISSLNQASFTTCVDRQMSLGVVLHDKALGSRIGVTGTPTVFMNGEMAANLTNAAQLHDRLSKKILESKSRTALR